MAQYLHPAIEFQSINEEMAYSGYLFRAIQRLFVSCIPAVELMDLPCISNKLTNEDMQGVKRKHECAGANTAARQMLECLKMKPQWFSALLTALDSPHLKMGEFKRQFLQLRQKVDKDWIANHPNCCPTGRSFRQLGGQQSPGSFPDDSGAASSPPSASSVAGAGSGASDETEPKLPHPRQRIPQEHSEQESLAHAESDDEDPYDTLRGPELQGQRWYHGNMVREKAESVMERSAPGSFLVRYSQQRRHFCLSIVGQSKYIHLRIKETAGPAQDTSHYCLSTCPEVFSSIKDLVSFFTDSPVATEKDAAIRLLNPIPSQDLPEIHDISLHGGEDSLGPDNSESQV